MRCGSLQPSCARSMGEFGQNIKKNHTKTGEDKKKNPWIEFASNFFFRSQCITCATCVNFIDLSFKFPEIWAVEVFGARPKTSPPPSGHNFRDVPKKIRSNVGDAYFHTPINLFVYRSNRLAPGACGSLAETRSRDLLTFSTYFLNGDLKKAPHILNKFTPLAKKLFFRFLGTIGACREVRPTRASNFRARPLAEKILTEASGRSDSLVGQLGTMFSQNLTVVGSGVQELWDPKNPTVFC